MSVCPNKSDPNYKEAVKQYGENQAKQMFIDNNYFMPKIVPDNNTTGNEFGKITYPQTSTLSLLNEKPNLASKIIDSLKRLFPEVVINKGGIIDKNGKYVDIPPGKKGMHSRNAFVSMVAWANDSYLETPPHEYAHHYIDMYYNTPLVQEAIAKYGTVEELATMMGRYYANNKMSSSFENWVKDFWNDIKSLVGSPDIGYEIAEAFSSNKNIGTIEEGLATINYQSTDQTRVRYEDGADLTSSLKESFSFKNLKEGALDLLKEQGLTDSDNLNYRDIGNKIRKVINDFQKYTTIKVAGKSVYSNTIEKRYLSDLENFISNDENLKSIKAFINKKNIGEKLTFQKGKTKDFVSKQDIDNVVKEIINNKKIIKGRAADGKIVELDSGQEYDFYYNMVTGKDYRRLTTHLSDDGPPDKTNPIIKSALNIGTKVDNLTRDFFANNLKAFSEYELGSDKMISDFIEDLKVIKKSMNDRGETVLANDIVLYDDEAGVAGTVDLLTYDKKGNFRIYDMKTMRGNQFNSTHKSGENKGQSKYKTPYKKGKFSNEEKHQKQLSGYRIMLNNTHGVDTKTIGVLPIEVKYEGGEERTTVLKKLPGFQHQAVNEVLDPTMTEFVEQEDFPRTTFDGKKNFIDLLGELENAKRHSNKSKDHLVTENGSFIKTETVVDESNEDIIKASAKREETYDRIKFKPLKKTLKFIEKNFLTYQINSRLVAKYLSGGEDTLLSKFSYKILNNAETKRNNLIMLFNNLLLEDSFSNEYKNWSYYKDDSKTIDELSTDIFSGTDKKNKTLISLKLTKAEMLSVYLMNRQSRASISMEKEGIILNDSIEGRDLKYNKEIILSKETIEDISEKIRNDKDLMKVVKNIDVALEFMGSKVADNFKKENGIELRLEENYFPVIAGSVNFDQRMGKSAINDFKSLNLSLGEKNAIRLVDPIQVLNSYKVNSASYVSLSLPIQNMRKIIIGLRSNYVKAQEEKYIDSIEEVLNKLEDPTQLYSGQGEKQFVKAINKLTNNFAVSVLGMNVPVMMKQSVSYITAKEEIDGKFLAMAGFGSSVLPFINPAKVLKSLKYTGVKDGKTVLPVEWDLNTDEGVYKLMKDYSPALRARLDGLVNRELGEALMNQDKNDDLIRLPGLKNKDGSNYEISKNRLMEGIRIFDAVTIGNIWKAAEFEAEEKYGLSRSDTEVFNTHVAIRVEEIVSRTQPNFNITDRSGLSTSQNPIARFFSMFSSATQKMAMLQIDSVIDTLQNPTTENKVKLLKRSANIMIMTGMMITIIDTLKGMALYGWDDDDEMFENFLISSVTKSFGIYYGVGQIASVVSSQLDNKPFYQNLQHPVELMAQDVAMTIANLAKGNLSAAVTKGLETTFKGAGLPLFPYTATKQILKRNLTKK